MFWNEITANLFYIRNNEDLKWHFRDTSFMQKYLKWLYQMN